jgi:citrate synthase
VVADDQVSHAAGNDVSGDTIVVYGQDLVEQVMGRWSFAELTYAALTGGTRPTQNQARMIDVLLTTFVDHGVTPSSLATRLTLLGAPEAMQAAIAAGLCGAGSRYLGTMQLAGEMLVEAMHAHGTATDPIALRGVADQVVASFRATKRQIPGLGHPEHKSGDPRTPKLLQIARETQTAGVHCDLLLAIADAFATATGRSLPLNAAGLAGAIVVDMGLPPVAARGLAVVSRAAGLAGIVLSELREPTAQRIWDGLR